MSEARQRVNAIQTQDGERTDADRAELATLTEKLQADEPELRAALAADTTETQTTVVDAETRERAELRSRTGIADYLRAAATGAEVTGAAREFAESVGVAVHGRLPLALFPEARPPLAETRAITVGPAVDGAVQPHVGYIWERTAAAAAGVQFKTVGAGQVQIPAVTTPPPADTLAKDGAAPVTAAAVSLVTRAPKRVSGAFEVRVEDLVVYPPLEAVLQEAMRTAIGNETDEQVFNGTGSGGDLTGLFQTATNKNADGTAETFVTGVSQFAALVDGKHAYGMTDVRTVVGSKTFARYASQFRNGSDGSLADYLVAHLGMFRVSDRMPSPTNADNQKGIVTLMASGDPICIYVWDALEIIRDPYSGAGAGKVTITAHALVSDIFVPHGVAQTKEINPKVA